ncbi:DUF2243 domain-containing protein [Neorhizobium sp. LMR1-1-1.1]
MITSSAPSGASRGKLAKAGVALGFGLGGFFDGILLHQILQWHHLLSGLQAGRLDIRTLILSDGLFHLLMYLVTCSGLWMLWRARRNVQWFNEDRRIMAFAAVGFGTWHIVDSVLSHWILGIHRVRMDVSNPLIWDLAWFAAFGVVPLIVALYLFKAPPASHSRMLSSPFALVLAACTAGSAALLPAPQANAIMVVFRPDLSTGHVLEAIGSVEGQILWNDETQTVWAIQVAQPARAIDLYRKGALLVGGSILPAGCFGWTRAS